MAQVVESQTKFISSQCPPDEERMVSTGIPTLDGLLGGGGYPERSAVLVVGPAGIGKEALGYYFTQAGLAAGDYCLYATRLTKGDILHDQKAFGVASWTKSPVWIARDGGEAKFDPKDLTHFQSTLVDLVAKSAGKKARVVLDVLSSLLMLNETGKVYEFVDGLIKEAKDHDAVILASLEDGMHAPQTQAAMEQLFDGVLELSFQRSGTRIESLLRVLKMRGTAPAQEFRHVSFSGAGVLIGPAESNTEVRAYTDSGAPFAGKEANSAFDFLLRAFNTDYRSDKLSIEQSGWRTRSAIAEGTGVDLDSLYGREGKFGQVLKELLSSGLVESRYFSGQRGRGGEVVRFRVACEKELVKRLLEKAGKGEGASSC